MQHVTIYSINNNKKILTTKMLFLKEKLRRSLYYFDRLKKFLPLTLPSEILCANWIQKFKNRIASSTLKQIFNVFVSRCLFTFKKSNAFFFYNPQRKILITFLCIRNVECTILTYYWFPVNGLKQIFWKQSLPSSYLNIILIYLYK